MIMDTIIWYIFAFARDMWLYLRFADWSSRQSHLLLEIKPPPDVLRTPKAMEMVFAGLHGIWNTIKLRDRYIQGEFYHPRLSLEMVGTDGQMHFYIRMPKKFRNFVEAHIYAQY